MSRRPAVVPSAQPVTAFYARVTADESKELSLPNQRKRFEEIALQHEWPTQLFVEPDAVSGELGPEKRPALRDLLAAVEAGEVDRVVVRHLDRLGRGVVLEQVVATLRQHEVELWSFDGPQDLYSAAGRLGIRAQAMVGAFEVERTGERVREMKRQRTRQGYYMGPAPYGFTSQARLRGELVAQYGKDGAERAREEAQRQIPVSGRLNIDEAEAAVVREVYRLYVEEGFGCGRIARRLNARGHRTRDGFFWTSQQIQKIIRDPKVAGQVTFDEDAYKRRVPSQAPVYKQSFYEAKHDAIIPIDLWRQAQEIRTHNRAFLRDHDHAPRVYPLTGAIFCLHGHPAKTKRSGPDGSATYYWCQRRFVGGTDSAIGGCDAPTMSAPVAEAAVRRVLVDLLGHPAEVKAYLDAASRQARRERAPKPERAPDFEGRIREMEKSIERYFKLLEGTEPGSEEEQLALQRVVALRRRIKEAEADRQDQRCEVIPLPPSVTRDQVETWCRELGAYLEDDAHGFRRLVEVLREQHDLKVQILDSHRVRVSLAIDPADVAGGRRLVAVARVEMEGDDGAVSTAEWVRREQAKDPRCACGCGGAITVRPHHRVATVGIPTYLRGHGKSRVELMVDEIHAAGFLTAGDLMKALGCGHKQITRLIQAGRLVPAGEWTVGGRSVRYFGRLPT